MATKFMKKLLAETGGKTINLFNPKTHGKVMNFYEKLYTKAGVTSDKALNALFNRAGEHRPYKVQAIRKNWGIK